MERGVLFFFCFCFEFLDEIWKWNVILLKCEKVKKSVEMKKWENCDTENKYICFTAVEKWKGVILNWFLFLTSVKSSDTEAKLFFQALKKS